MDTMHILVFLMCYISLFVAEGLNISETAGTGTLILNNTGRVNCSIFHVNPNAISEYFKVSEEQNLLLVKPLDLEVIYTFFPNEAYLGINVTLNCTNKPMITTSIFVTPVNEFSPEFVNKPYEVIIPEDIPTGTTVYCFCTNQTVIDGDKIKYGHVINFTFITHEIQGLDGAHKFSIDPVSGNITTLETFDYESRDKFFFVKVQAMDEDGRTGDVSIKINVSDVDDNPPRFTRPGCVDITCAVTTYSADIDIFKQGYVTNISPSRIHAMDIDVGINNRLNYTMVPVNEDVLVSNWTSNVRINSSTGYIYIEESFLNITNDIDIFPISLQFEISAAEISAVEYSTNGTLMVNIYRSLTTTVPTSTSELPETTEVPTSDSKDKLFITLIEIIVPSIIVIAIAITVAIFCVRIKRQAKERSKYEVKAGSNVYKNVLGDRDMAVEARSSLVISPYELLTLYDNSNYARFDSMQDKHENTDAEQGRGQFEGQVSVIGDVQENGAIEETADGVDSLYARVEKKKSKSSKSKAKDVFTSDNPGADHHDNVEGGDENGDDDASESQKDVKNLEY